MRRARRKRMRIALALAVLAAVVVVANEIARPGCALLRVAMPTDPYRSGPGGTRAQACAALGRPRQEVRALPLGLHEPAAPVGGPPPITPDNHRFVSVFYAIGTGENLIELMSTRGNGIPPGNVGQVNGSVNGAPAIIDERTFPAQGGGAFTMVFYLWPDADVLLSLHVRLDQGITREIADRIAASVR